MGNDDVRRSRIEVEILLKTSPNGEICEIPPETIRLEITQTESEALTHVVPWSDVLFLDSQGTFTIRLHAPGCWSPSVIAPVEAKKIELPVWPGSVVRGHFTGSASPESAEWQWVLTPVGVEHANQFEPQRDDCVVEGKRWACSVPALEIDAKLQATGFVPLYWWGLEPRPGEELDLGESVLERASSVAGWVLDSTGKPPIKSVQVTAERHWLGKSPQSLPPDQQELVERFTARTTSSGFFQIVGLTEGEYVLLTEAEKGLFQEAVPTVRVEVGMETLLATPISLAAYSQVVVHASSAIDGSGRPWILDIARGIPLTNNLRNVVTEPLRAGGHEIPALEPGDYLLTLKDADGNDFAKKWLTLAGEATVAVHFEPDRVPIRGRVTAGDKPVTGVLEVQDLMGKHLRFPIDEQGRFRGDLPHEGDWIARLRPRTGRGTQQLGTLPVFLETGEPVVTLHLNLPATRLSGKVVDSEGEALSQALVTVYRGDRPELQAYTGDNGEFELSGLEPGFLTLKAESRDGASRHETFELEEGSDDSAVKLKIESARRVDFLVTTDFRPMAGVRVHAKSTETVYAMDAVSGPNGRLYLLVPPDVESFDIIALAAGYPVTVQHISTSGKSPGEPLPIQIVSSGGEVVVPTWTTHVFVEEAVFPLRYFLRPRGRSLPELDPTTGLLTLSLAPGEYTFCSEPLRSKDCASGYLAPGGVLPLTPKKIKESGR